MTNEEANNSVGKVVETALGLRGKIIELTYPYGEVLLVIQWIQGFKSLQRPEYVKIVHMEPLEIEVLFV